MAGDCLEVLRGFPEQRVDLIVTSPPYADRRPGGISPDEYTEWFMARATQFARVLHPEGSFVLNIKENVINGERSTYVIELVLALRKAGWLWTEEYIWHKRNSMPGRWPNRLRDAWEHCYHFTLSRRFRMYQDAVRVPIGDWAERRMASLSEADMTRQSSRTGSGVAKRVANWAGRTTVLPTNVLHFATESHNRGHHSAFPEALPEFFIKLFTEPGHLVLDPFCGTGTTCVVADRLGRDSVGIDVDKAVRLRPLPRLR
jgi:site-specific DNA-methyltransferase (adenine-specific)